jgi:hypothetical protein
LPIIEKILAADVSVTLYLSAEALGSPSHESVLGYELASVSQLKNQLAAILLTPVRYFRYFVERYRVKCYVSHGLVSVVSL